MKKLPLLITTLILSGCIGTSPQSQFYMLKSINEQSISKKQLQIAIEPVKIPTYLDKPQIVSFEKDSFQLNVSETKRWAEPLNEQIQRVIINDLSNLLPQSLIRKKTFSQEKYDYIIYVDIHQLDATFNQNIELSVWWSLLDKNGNIIYKTQTKLTEKLSSENYEDLVALESQLIAQLSQKIAKEILKQ
ncbi:MAG: membrane integrity-associated transporter subunit PqiC [Alphaproteobacteria bacterium]|nr:membrane integrity-associated transporter subunit PqiC [Alphaproteobacteria bacterium]